MATGEIIHIPLQVGSEFRIKKTGEISLSNPTLELESSEVVADVVLSYRFERETGDHIIGVVEPLSFKSQP